MRFPILRDNGANCFNRFNSPLASASQERPWKNSSRNSSARLQRGCGYQRGSLRAGGIAAVIAAMTSAAVADVTGVLAASAAIIGTIVALSQRRKILRIYERQMEAKRSELMQAIEQQLKHAIELFYKEVSTAVSTAGSVLRRAPAKLRAVVKSARRS